MKKIKVKKGEMPLIKKVEFVNKWLEKHGLTREFLQAEAYKEGMGKLTLDHYFQMAIAAQATGMSPQDYDPNHTDA